MLRIILVTTQCMSKQIFTIHMLVINVIVFVGEGRVSLIGYNFAKSMAIFVTCKDLVEGQKVSIDSLCRGPDGVVRAKKVLTNT